MDTLGIIAIIIAVLGILGGFLPVLPGPPLSWVALFLVYLSDKAADPLSRTALLIYLAVATALTIFDYILPGMMTRLTGGHPAAEKGALVGMIVGLFLTPIGMVLGSFLGAFICEYISEKQDAWSALRAATGAFLAFILTTGMKVVFSSIVLWQVLAHLL